MSKIIKLTSLIVPFLALFFVGASSTHWDSSGSISDNTFKMFQNNQPAGIAESIFGGTADQNDIWRNSPTHWHPTNNIQQIQFGDTVKTGSQSGIFGGLTHASHCISAHDRTLPPSCTDLR
jgi:hypothetical protein